jgi:hypothetical protein
MLLGVYFLDRVRPGGMSSGPQFFQTRMGRTFLEGTMPRIARGLERLSDHLAERAEYRVLRVGEGLEEKLNELAEQGFVVKATASSSPGQQLVVLERRGGGGR